MKILQLGKFYPIQGGVEKVMYDLTIGLSRTYQDVWCDMMCVAATPREFKQVLNDRSNLYSCRLNKKLFSTMLSVDLVNKLRQYCKEYDIIHIHHPDPMATLALILSGYKGKVVLHWHSDILKQKLLLKFYRPLQTWLINRADVIIGTTPKYLAESPHLLQFNKRKYALPIGIERIEKKGAEKIKSVYPGKKIIFTLGRLVEYKGYKYLIQAAKYLPKECVILIGGSGPLRDELQSLIDDNNLTDKVKLLGRISDEDLPSYYSACDLFALSSIWKTEAFAIVQIEAMSCGKPIVATKIPESGVSWVNKHGVSGLNVEPENSKELANAINEILSSSELYQKYSDGALNRFENNFTISSMIESCRKIYDLII